MDPNGVVSVQIQFHGELEQVALILSLVSPFYDTDRESEDEYEYIYGQFESEIIEINRRLGAETAGVFTHNNPAVFSSRALGHVLSSLKGGGIAVLSYQTIQDLKAGSVSKVA